MPRIHLGVLGTGAAALSLLANTVVSAPVVTAASTGTDQPIAPLTAPTRVPVRQDSGAQQSMVLPPSGKSPTWADITRVYHTLAPALRITRTYATESAARRAGFQRLPGIQASMFVTFARQGRGTSLNVSKPASLVYMDMGGPPLLAAVGYSMPATTTPQQLDATFPASLAAWHQDLNVCQAAKHLSLSRAAGIHDQASCTARGGAFAPAGRWSITAWIGQPRLGLFQSEAVGMAGMSMGATGAQKIMEMTQEPYQMEMLTTNGAPISWSDVSRVYKLLLPAKAANRKYQDVAVARKDGFITAPFLYVPGQGAHYVRASALSLTTATVFDVKHPPVLVYNEVHGRLKLSSLLYLMPISSTPQELARVFPPSMASWHRHVNTCVVGVKVVPIHDAAACHAASGFFLGDTGWMVHAWLFDTATGVFDMDQE